MGQTIAITSGKGGVGKSSVCVNIGFHLARKGYRVCMIDCDLGLKNLDVMMGLENRVLYDLRDAMEGRCTLQKAVLKDKREDNLYLLPACKSVNLKYFQGSDLKAVVAELKKSFDYILLDTPAGIESGFVHSIACCERVILVTTLDITAVQDADRIIGILMKEDIQDIELVINRLNPKYIEKGISIRLEDALSWLSIPLLGYVFDDESVIRANNRGIPVALNQSSYINECYQCIVKRLLKEDAPLPKYKEKKLFQKLFG
ncbi:MAG: septum site-determining protein MinD [Erysipelotrichaceae bacterium]|nr:septum site-determining protein MinD [Erysipelotrichaceae bacterium]